MIWNGEFSIYNKSTLYKKWQVISLKKTAKSLVAAFILIALALVPALLLSCSGDGPEAQDGSRSAADFESGTTEKKSDGLDGFDFGGYEYRVFGLRGGDSIDYAVTIDVEIHETDKIINEAIYTRNRRIEQRFDITYKAIYRDDFAEVTNYAKKAIKSGTDEFDEIMILDREALGLATGNMLYSINDLPHVNLDNPWWDKLASKEISIGGNYMFAYGDDCISYFDHIDVIVFNKRLITDYSLENPFALVENNNWTLDKMFEMGRAVVKNLGGGGEMTKEDQWGILAGADIFFPDCWMSSGEKLVKKDADDIPYFAVPGNARIYDVFEHIYTLVYGGEKCAFVFPGNTPEIVNRFMDEKALFAGTFLENVHKMRAMEGDFGILPYPKYDASQDRYYCRCNVAFPYVVPVTNTDLERTSVIAEARAAMSKETVVKAYYDVSLKTKSARDVESEAMIDLIYESRTIDLGDTFWFDSVRRHYHELFYKGQNSFTSTTEKIQPAADKAIRDVVNKYLSLE